MNNSMSAQHTPGPWTAKASPESGYFEWTVHVRRITVGVDTDNSAADARLMAAAPELLQALQDLQHHCHLAGFNLKSGTALAFENARAAIANATGSAA